MSNGDDRLTRCFTSVFPALEPEEVRAASVASLEAWDSLASVTLASVVRQEFALEVNMLDLLELDSFEAFRAYLRRLSPAVE